MTNRLNLTYQQSLKGTQTTGNNLSQFPNDNTQNITDLYKQDSVSSEPPIVAINSRGDTFIEQPEDAQHNQIKIFMKKAQRLNQMSYRKLHEGKVLMPQSSSINIYKSSKNILQEFSLPTHRDKQIKAIYLRGSKDTKRQTKNKLNITQRTNSLYKKKFSTDSKWVQTQSINVQRVQIKSQLTNYQTSKTIDHKNHSTLPKKLKKTLNAIQQDQDEQFIPVKRKNPQKMFNTISLTSDLKRTKVDANSYLSNVAKNQHQFNKSVKRYSLKQQFQQPTIFNNPQRNTNQLSFLQPIVNQSTFNPWSNMEIEQQKIKQQKILPMIKQKSQVNEQTVKNTLSSTKQPALTVLTPQPIIPKIQKANAVQQTQHQNTQNSLFVENNNNSTKRSKVSESQFTIFKATHSNNFYNNEMNGFKFEQKQKIKQKEKEKQKQKQFVQQTQTYVQVPQIRQIAIGTDTNNFILHSKKPIHPISISFPDNQSRWITSEYQPKSQFLKNIDTKTFDIKKYRNGVYFGQISEEGAKNGKGVVFYFNGRSYQGNFVDDMKQGKGFQYMPDGSMYSGDFNKGLKQGRGVFQWPNGQVYDGQWAAGKKNGSGMWKSPKGDAYIGEWKNGKIQGFGVLTIKEGDRYEGQFKNSMKNGLGTERYANGDTYVGQFIKNRPNGQGQYYYHNGDFYKGLFSNGLKHGNGYFKCANQTYQGEFRNQKKCGYGQQTNEEGKLYKGNFQNGLKHGYGQLFTDGIPTKGYWINGQLVQTQMGPIIQDQLDRQQSIVNIKINSKRKQKNQILAPIRKAQKIKSPKKSPKVSKEKSLSPSDPNFHRACGCKRKH